MELLSWFLRLYALYCAAVFGVGAFVALAVWLMHRRANGPNSAPGRRSTS